MRHRCLLAGLPLLFALLHAFAVAADPPTDTATAAGVSIDELLSKAQQGDGEAQADVGELYATGIHAPQDFERSAVWRARAAAQGITHAQNALGKQYAAGLGVPQDNKKALSWLERAAATENPAFWFDLAVFYEQAGGDQALASAVAWHTRAVDAGHVGAHAHLGLLYYSGTGVSQDLPRAAELLAYAARRGHARAQNNLGLMYTRGRGVEQDYDKAVALFQSAADQGLKQAYTNLGVMYANGFGVKFNETKAADLYRRARLQGSLDGALEQIGFLADPRFNVHVATPEALRRLLEQAKLGDALAQFQSGYLLLGFDGVVADYATAADLLKKAADNGVRTAMSNLGLLYFRGLGVPQDYVLGFMWVSLGANGGRKGLVETRNQLASYLSASQINDAQKMAREHRKEYRKPVRARER